MHRLLSCLSAALLGLSIVALGGCKPEAFKQFFSEAVKPVPDHVSVMTDSVNYMHDMGLQYTLYDLSTTPPTPVGGAIDGMLASGGEKGCCISLPTTWKPDMKVRVQWQESDYKKIYPEKYSRDLEIPRYDKASDLYVVFYPNHEVEVVVSVGEPGNPEWRGRIKQTPWEHCVGTVGRKACKAALPKLFGVKESQGFCTYLIAEHRPDAENLCESAMDECMGDYEDEVFCKQVIWNPCYRTASGSVCKKNIQK